MKESMFVKKDREIGELHVGVKTDVEFQLQGWTRTLDGKYPLPSIVDISPSCGCTNTEYDPIRGVITLHYTPGMIPYHLEEEGKYIVKKYADVTIHGIGEETCSFSATVVK